MCMIRANEGEQRGGTVLDAFFIVLAMGPVCEYGGIARDQPEDPNPKTNYISDVRCEKECLSKMFGWSVCSYVPETDRR